MSTELLPPDGGSRALTKRDTQSIAVVASNPMELLSMAVRQGADIGTIERLEAMQERFEKREAKKAFDSALAAFQAECPVILKTVSGAQNKYKFAPLDHIVTQVKPLLEHHGFSYRLTADMAGNQVKATIKVTHTLGHMEESTFEVPTDSRNNLMNAAQQVGGAMTFAKRYAFCNAFGILTADEDRDGQTAQAKRGLKAIAAERTAQAGGFTKTAPTPPAPEPPRPAATNIETLKAKLWKSCISFRGDQQSWATAEVWMRARKILKPAQTVSQLTEDELIDATDKVQIETAQT